MLLERKDDIHEMIYAFAIQQSGHLDVVVPPDILNSPEISADESVTNEGGNVQLMCQATGVPEPRLVDVFSLPSSPQLTDINGSLALVSSQGAVATRGWQGHRSSQRGP